MIRQSRCRLAVVSVTIVSFVAGCQKWVSIKPPIGPALEEKPANVRVSTGSHSMVFDTVWVVGDTVFGIAGADTVAVPLSDIAHAERRESNATGTVLLITAGALVVVALVVVNAGFSSLE